MGTDGVRRNATLVCVPLMADSTVKMHIDMDRAKARGADLVELRLDYLKNFSPPDDLRALFKDRPLPVLCTLSFDFANVLHLLPPTWEGGEYDGDENKRQEALRLALELGADYVDVELQVACQFLDSVRGKKPDNCKVIVSSHNYKSTPSVEELGNLVARIQESGADIVKISTTATDVTDVARIFQIIVHSQVPTIGIVMGDKGLISRVLSGKFGGYLTFATIEAGVVSAPGQPLLEDLFSVYNFRQIGPDTKVFGIIGNPVYHSKSPVLHNKAFKSVGINGVFVYFLVDDIDSFLKTYSSPDFTGFSVTIPFKEVAVRICDEVDPVAKSIGAVNTIIRRSTDGMLTGYNTDYIGAISAIEDGLRGKYKNSSIVHSPLAGKRFVVIGAGGAGKAVAYGAKEKGAKVVIANRTYARAKELADIIGGEALTLDDLYHFHPEDDMILANTTSIGMLPNTDDMPIPKHALKWYSLVFDAVYTPKITRLLKEAEESGAMVVTGVEMFIRQALGQFEKFSGSPVSKEVFEDIMSFY